MEINQHTPWEKVGETQHYVGRKKEKMQQEQKNTAKKNNTASITTNNQKNMNMYRP